MSHIKKRVYGFSKKAIISFVAMATFLSMTGVPYLAPVKIAQATAAPTTGQVVISEIQTELSTGNRFVELYNTTPNDLELQDCTIEAAGHDATNLTSDFTPSATVAGSYLIPAHGYFLFAKANYEPYGMVPDVVDADLTLDAAGGFVALKCAAGIIDQVGYGTVTTDSLCKGDAVAPSDNCAPVPGDGSIERKAATGSTAGSMGYGGTDEFLGNSFDAGTTDADDFVTRAPGAEQPQKSTSPSESELFIITDIMPMGPQRVSVKFNRMIKMSSIPADLSALATLSTADTSDDSAITSVTIMNGNELEIYASGANINSSAGTDQITITDVLTDTSSTPVANSATSAQTIQMFMSPEITGVKYQSDSIIKVYFSKAMEETSTIDKTAYEFFVNKVDAGANPLAETNMTLALDTVATGGTGKILTVTDTTNSPFANLSNAGTDYVKINYSASTAPKDLQGSKLEPTFGWQTEFAIDYTKPEITTGIFDTTTDKLTLYFSEELLSTPGCEAEKTGNYTFGGGTCTNKTVAFKQNSSGPPSFDVIVISCTVLTFATGNTVTVNATNVTDKSGNLMQTVGSKNIFTAAGTSNNAITIQSVSGDPSAGSDNMMMEGCTDDYGNTTNYYKSDADKSGCGLNDVNVRDRLIITFDEAIKPSSINYDTTNSIAYNIGSYLEVFTENSREPSTPGTCNSWETWNAGTGKCVEKMMGNLGNSFGVLSGDSKTLTVYLQGESINFWPGMQVKPAGITGINNLLAVQNSNSDNNTFTMTFTEVEKIVIDKSNGNVDILDALDTIDLYFSKRMKKTTITANTDATTGVNNVLKPCQHMPFYQEHIWATDPAGILGWNIAGQDPDGNLITNRAVDSILRITLGAGTTVADKDEIMVYGLTSFDGVPLGWGGKIDSTALALSNYIWNSTDKILILEFNKMLRDYNGVINSSSVSSSTFHLTNNAIKLNGANITTATTAVFDMAGGGGTCGMDMFKKIKLDLAPTAIVDTDSFVFSSSNVGDENGNLIPTITVSDTPGANKVVPVGDSTPPKLAKVFTNDWNHDGILNGGDEIIFKFDNEATNTDSKYICDVDYSILHSTSIGAQFTIKRDGVLVPYAFGNNVCFWVDMWEEHAGELHINLGPGSDIQAGDEIWAAAGATLADFGSNEFVNGANGLATIKESRDAEISKIVFDDQGTTGLSHNDTFVVHFSSAIDPNTLGSYTAGADPDVAYIDWGLGIEFNWETGNTADYSGAMKTWGSSSTAKWNGDFTQLTITVDCNDDSNDACNTSATDAWFADSDMVMSYGIQTADGAWVNKPGFIDLTAPSISHVLGEKAGATWAAGDKLSFGFSESMDDATITELTLGTLKTELGADGGEIFGSGAASAAWLDPEKRYLEVTLGADTTIVNTTKFKLISAVKDKNGNAADQTVDLKGITLSVVKPVSSVVLTDNDTTYPGIDGRDVKVAWTAPGSLGDAGYDNYSYDIYLLPNFVAFDPDATGTYSAGETSHFPIARATHTTACGGTTGGGECSYVGLAGLMSDSRTAVSTSTGIHDGSSPFFMISDWEEYTAYVIAINNTDRSFPQKDTTPIRFAMEYGSGMDNQAPWIEHTTPYDGAIVPLNKSKMSIKFSEPMKKDIIETDGKIKLQTCSSDCHEDTNWSDVSGVFVSYDTNYQEAQIDLTALLVANNKYRFYIPPPGVEDLSGFTVSGELSHFRASAESDTTPPKVVGNSFQFEGIGGNTGATVTGIPRTEPMVGIAFSKDMDHSTFDTTSVTLAPTVPGSSFHYDPMMMGLVYSFGSPLAKGQTYTLTLSGVYIKDVSGNTLDGDKNETASGTTSDNHTLTFTAVDTEIDTTIKPKIIWINSDGHHMDVGFDRDMKESTITNRANWTLKDASGSIVNLQLPNFDYDFFMNELHIGPLQLNFGETYTFNPNASILGTSGAVLDSANSVKSFTPENWDVSFTGGTFGADMYETGGMFGTGGMFHDDNMTVFDEKMTHFAPMGGPGTHMGSFDPMMGAKMLMPNAFMDQDIKMFSPIDAWPMNKIAGETSNYHIGFPTSKAIPHGGKIILKFPVGFDVTNAAVATDDFMPGTHKPLFFFNQDINGPGGIMDKNGLFSPNGKVQIKTVEANNANKTITLTIDVEDSDGCTLEDGTTASAGKFKADCTAESTAGTNSTMAFDYIDFELSGIVNGTASEVDWRSSPPTGGYQVLITTKDNDGGPLEGGEQPIASMRFPIKPIGKGSISGTVTAEDGVTAVANALVFVDSPMGVMIDTITGTNGVYTVSNLPVAATGNDYEGWYHIHVESPKNTSTYFGGADFDVQLTEGNLSASDKNVKLKGAANDLVVKLTITDALDKEDIMVWVGGPEGHNEQKFTLSKVDDDGDPANGVQDWLTIKIADGEWDVGVHPFFAEASYSHGAPPPPAFLSPAPKHITASGDTNVSMSLIGAIADYEIAGMVRDASTAQTVNGVIDMSTATGLKNVHVHAFSHFGQGFHADADTRSDGSFTLKVPSGFYEVEAHMPGLPMIPSKTVEVKGVSVSGVEIIVQKPAQSIAGTVSDGTNGIAYAGVNAWDDKGRFVFTETDANGEYVLFTEPSSSWSVEVFAPGFGKLQADTGVTTTNLNTLSGNVTGVDFTTANSNIVTIQGTVKDGSGNAVSGVKVRADEMNYINGAEVDMTGVGVSAVTNADGAYVLKVAASTAGDEGSRYKISANDESVGDLTPVSGIDASSSVSNADDSKLNLSMPAARTITIDVQNYPTDGEHLLDPDVPALDANKDFFMGKAFLNVYSETSDKGNRKEIIDTDLSDASDGSINVPKGSGYRASLYIPGYGEFEATENGGATGNGFSVGDSNKTVHFDLRRDGAAIAPITIEGKATDASSTAIADAYVSIINEDTFEVAHERTDSLGDYKLKVPNKNSDGTTAKYKVRIDMDGYTPSAATEHVETSKTGASAVNFELAANTSTITGVVYTDAAKTIPAANAVVTAQEIGGEGFVKIKTDDLGRFNSTYDNALDVTPAKTWNVLAKSTIGKQGQQVNIKSGNSNLEIVLTDQIKVAEEGELDTTPRTESFASAGGGTTISQLDTAGIKLEIPDQTFGASGTVHVTVKETAALPETSDFKPLGGVGKDIQATQDITPGKMVGLEFVYNKVELEAMTETTATANNLAPLDQVRNVYWDESANNYVPLSTTRTVEVKASSGDEWTPTDWDTFITDVSAGKDVYDDYKVTLKSDTSHFTLFGLKIGNDSVAPGAPAAPANLAATSGDGSITLDWDDNTETDFWQYTVYRNTSAGVSITDNDYQANSLQLTTSAFTNNAAGFGSLCPAPSNWTSYYYVIIAADDSRNLSSASNEVQVCPHPDVANAASVSDTTCAIVCNDGYSLSNYECIIQGTAAVSGGGGGGATGPSAMPVTTSGEVTATYSGGGKTTLTTDASVEVSVKLPAYAVSTSTKVVIAPVEITETALALDTAPVVVVSAMTAVPVSKSIVGGQVYNMTATSSGVAVSSFSKRATIILNYTDAQISGLKESSLTINYWDETDEQWVELPTTVNKVSNKLTAKTLHFTYFGIMGEEGIDVEEGEDLVIDDGQEIVIGCNAIAAAQIRYQIRHIIKQLIVLITELITVYQQELLELQSE